MNCVALSPINKEASLTKRYSKAISSRSTHRSTVDVLGSGPVPITPRDGGSAEEVASQQGCRVALREDVGPGVAESLLRYVNDFGQGKGSARVENGLTWLELQFREDREMLKSQFRDLFQCREAAHERCL